MVRGGMIGYCRGGFRMDALMSVKLISLLSPKGLREGNPGVLELEIDWVLWARLWLSGAERGRGKVLNGKRQNNAQI